MATATVAEVGFKPRILVFSTHNISDPGIDLAGSRHLHYPATATTIAVPCSSGLRPSWIVHALEIGIDGVFGYGSAAGAPGRILAAGIGARYVPVTAPGRLEAVAAGRSRRPSCPRESVPRICLFGPESTGKSTLGLALAEHFGTVMAPEYGRLYTETFGQECGAEDLRRIVIGHRAGTRAAGRWANAVLIEDTDPVLTAIWSDVLTGQRDPWFEGYRDTADLYLLTGIDVPWVADDVRYFPAEAARRDFHDRCRAELVRRALDFVEVTGDPATRLATALEAIRERFPDIAA